MKLKPGTSKSIKGQIVQGRGEVPLSVVTRLLKLLEGKSGAALDRIFYQGMAKYDPLPDQRHPLMGGEPPLVLIYRRG